MGKFKKNYGIRDIFLAFFGFYSLGGKSISKKPALSALPRMVRKGQKGWFSVSDGSAIGMENRKRGTGGSQCQRAMTVRPPVTYTCPGAGCSTLRPWRS